MEKQYKSLAGEFVLSNRQKKNYELRMYIPIPQGQSGSWDSFQRPWWTIGEAPNIPTNIPPEPKKWRRAPTPTKKRKQKKKCWLRFAIICFQGTHNHRHIFHAASCKWVPPLRWLWPDVHPSWGSSWEVSPVQGNGAHCSEICGGNDRCSKSMIWLWVWIHVNINMNIMNMYLI